MDTTELMALSPPDEPCSRLDVLRVERAAVAERRIRIYGQGPHDDKPLTGLAFSGGGIRSATFCLGVLEELEQRGVRPVFDYLSTVSGGGYIGSWWSAYLARKRRSDGRGLKTAVADAVRPVIEAWAPLLADKGHDASPAPASEPPLFHPLLPRETFEPRAAQENPARRDPRLQEELTFRHLRLHSNYLIPRKGLSWDTWRAITVISRNLVLTWAELLPFVMAAVIECHTYFI